MIGPGSDLALKEVDEVARTLADGMENGRIIIPTHEEVWDTLAEHWADPDAFIRRKIAAIAGGDNGRPRPTPEQIAAMTAARAG